MSIRRPYTTGLVLWRAAMAWGASTGMALSLGLASMASHAEVPAAPVVDASALPAVPDGWAEPNPLRGQPEAIRVGRDAFNQACARCHGADANGSRSPAPDLRRVGSSCKKVQDPALQQRCLADADFHFIKSVRLGKKKFGIEHMPAWDPVLTPQLAWALRTFVENAPKDTPKDALNKAP